MDELGTTEKRFRRFRDIPFLLAGFLTIAAIGCGWDVPYVISAAIGQFDLIGQSVPIEEAIEDGNLSDEQVRKLSLIRDVRQWAGQTLALNIVDNYTLLYDAGDSPVAYNVSACRKDALEPKTWWFPVIGTIPYLGFFDKAAAEARIELLKAEGLDVYSYEIDAYSTLGAFPNPILSPMLERSDTDLVETVIHELLHSTIWHASETSFNESLATFVGRRGAMLYYAARYPDDPNLVMTIAEQFEDVDTYQDFSHTLLEDLDAYYSSNLTSEEKIAGREEVFSAAIARFFDDFQPLMNNPEDFAWVANLPVNNAWVAGIRRYNLELDVFETVLEAFDGNLAAAIPVFAEASKASSPYDFLAKWPDTEKLEERFGPANGTILRGVCPRRLPTTIIVTE